MPGSLASRSTDSDARRATLPPDDVSIALSAFSPEPGVCPKCLAPIEPERLPDATLCLDCVVER